MPTTSRSCAAALAALLLAAPAAAQTTRINTGGGPDEPAGHHSWLIGNARQSFLVRPSPDFVYDIRDDELASWLFSGTPMGTTPHTSMLFTMGQCHAGGFIDDLSSRVGLGSSIGIAAAARWDKCSLSDNGGNTFLQPWGAAVDAPHPANDRFLDAFNAAVAADPVSSGQALPQYYGFDADNATLGLGGGNNSFYLLWVGETQGRPDYFLDIDQIHTILRTQYGADEDHIFALYGNGVRRDAADAASAPLPAWVDGAGSRSELESTINAIDGSWVPNDGFFFWSSNHGYEGAGISSAPEPATVALTGGGLVALVLVRRRRR